MMIDVRDYSVGFLGMNTLRRIEADLDELYQEGITGVTVDFRGMGINKEYTKFLSWLKYKYGSDLKGIGDKKYDIDIYIHTGYYIKENMGRVEYSRWMVERIKEAGYPLMIRDNRLKGDYRVPLNVIQPIKIDKRYLYMKVIKPMYLEPMYLEQAIKEGKEIYTREEVGITEIGDKTEGIRFASTQRERAILDIFKDILDKRVIGFSEVD